MDINIVSIIVILVLAALAWFANETLNKIPVAKPFVSVIIVIVTVLMLLQSMGLVGGHSTIRIS